MLALARCFDEPDYAGLACRQDVPCPIGFACNEANVCERVCRENGDCPSGATCIAERCSPRNEQDASTAECEASADCTSPGPCEVIDDRVACVDRQCRYPKKACDQPPPGECIDNNTKYRSYSGVGACDPASNDCDYAELVIDCLDCLTSCLLRCEGLTCNESNGGCRSGGYCVPDDPPACAYTDEPDSTPCELPTAPGGYCRGGDCVECVEDLHCDDANACTEDTCLTETSSCSSTPISASCDDGNACTMTDSCEAGACVGSDPVLCDLAPGPCFEAPGECDPADGACIYTEKQPGSACDDANSCTTGDACMDGDCIGTGALDCNDENPCTDDGCDAASGCTRTNNTTPCDDGNACTVADLCSQGACAPGTPLDCDDMNPCTTDGCDPSTGCKRVNLPDDSACSFPDGTAGVCAQGSCVGCVFDSHCDDGNPCTTDHCDAGNCVRVNNTASCDDRNACTYGDQCSQGTCSGTTITCASNACVTRSCNGTATCTQTFRNGAACPDDGNACTTDVCNGSGSCTHPSRADGASCGSNANRCCGGSCVNISTSESHCGGCNTSCAAGLTCESVSVTSGCSSAPLDTSGRCRCNASNAQCPRNQVCRTVSPYTNRCTPNGATNCAPGTTFVDISTCPNYCRY